MLAKFLFTTIPGSILLASVIISSSVLVSGKAIKEREAVAPVQIQAPQPQPTIQPTIQPTPDVPVKVDIGNNPVLGEKNAPITLVEFSDYECPYCKKSFEQLLPELKKNYISTGKLKLVYKNLPLPFHQNAAKEAEASLCARDQGGDKAFYFYHDQIFTKTVSGGTGIALSDLPVIAEDLGLKVTTFQKCLDTGKFKAQVDKDIAEASKVGASGTPTWFLGKTTSSDSIEGVKIVGAQPFSAFKSAIEEQLSR